MPTDNLELYQHWRVTNRATLGFRGEVVDADDCPTGSRKCAPSNGTDCPHFMGHRHPGAVAYVGDTAPMCCAELLRKALAQESVDAD